MKKIKTLLIHLLGGVTVTESRKKGDNSWLCKKYGKLPENWQQFINDSIHECMRVLADFGVLIFKWNEQQIKVNDVLKAITDYRPVFGHRTTIKNNTIWMAFMKFPKGGEE